MNTRAKRLLDGLLADAGIHVGGNGLHDIRINDDRFYGRVLAGGSLGLGEAYVDGWWDCDRLDEFFATILRDGVHEKIPLSFPLIVEVLRARLFNPQRGERAYRNAQAHYDKGNDLYAAMLDTRLTYTCGYWKDARGLDAAQEAKLDLVCRKIGLRPGQTVLDIGCGWGSFVKFAAERYGAKAVGVTVSKEQAALGRELCKGLPVEIRLEDYRETLGVYDHVVSLGMFEHVGAKNYRAFMRVARERLKDDGLFLLHTIGSGTTMAGFDPWMDKYVFPNAHLPSMKELSEAAEGLFIAEDVHNFGADYDTTLMAWHANFERHWLELQSRYDERFRRLWRYYLLVCAGGFRSRLNHLWQIVYSKQGVPGGYTSVR